MALCRYSSIDFLCDLYVYETEPNGFSVNVARKRRVYKQPLPERISPCVDVVAYHKRFIDIMLMENELVDIGLPYDGQSFSCDTAEELVDVLTMLKVKPHKMKKFKAKVRLQQIIEEWKQSPEHAALIKFVRENYRPFWGVKC